MYVKEKKGGYLDEDGNKGSKKLNVKERKEGEIKYIK